jgi:hypothetical protein
MGVHGRETKFSLGVREALPLEVSLMGLQEVCVCVCVVCVLWGGSTYVENKYNEKNYQDFKQESEKVRSILRMFPLSWEKV